MANENKDIGEIVKKCKILLLDIEGTTTSISFVKDKLFPYAEENVKKFLDSQWDTDDVKEAVAALRKLALEDQEKSVDGAVAIPGNDASKEAQIEGVVNNVKWQMSSDRKAGALKQLQGLIWKQGYDSGDIKGHVYDDVSPALEQWRSVEGQKVYIYSSGSIQAQKLLFGQSLSGDLLKFIDGHFDTGVGAKQEAASYTGIVEKIGVKAEDILFLTDIPKEAEAARTAGLSVALVSREGNAPLPSEATDAFPVIHSLAQLTVTNKRKTEPQDEQPAKVPKTETDGDVKTTLDSASSEHIASEEKQPVKEVQSEETMEVEEIPVVKEATDTGTKVEETPAHVETIVEVPVSVDPVDAQIIDAEPIVTEADGDKTKETEKMDTEISECTESEQEIKASSKTDESTEIATTNEIKGDKKGEPKDNGDKTSNDTVVENVESSELLKENSETKEVKDKTQKAGETLAAVVTEIEEITSDNQCMGDVADIIEDLEPLVEEPSDDMEDLQNVGEVLEKECDEILSKVQDVTNLDSIPLKPLLNTIVEETMDTEIDAENMDSNDIVERILDTELELEIKQSSSVDLNTVSAITEDLKKEQVVEKNNTTDSEKHVKPAEKIADNQENTNSTTEEMITVSSQSATNTDKKDKNMDAVENAEVKSTVEVESGAEGESIANVEKSAETENNKVGSSDKVESGTKIEGSDIEENSGIVDGSDKVENSNKVENGDKVESSDKVESKTKIETNDTDEKNDNMDTSDKIENTDKAEIEDTKETAEKVEIADNVVAADKLKDSVEVDEKKTTEEPGSKEKSDESSAGETTTKVESMDTETVTEVTKSESEKDNESQVNGTATNGEAINVNGDASNAEELKSRLSVENGKEPINGSNGNSVDSDKGQGDNKMEAEVSDIKVKTVATEEPHTDPIEQPTEA